MSCIEPTKVRLIQHLTSYILTSLIKSEWFQQHAFHILKLMNWFLVLPFLLIFTQDIKYFHRVLNAINIYSLKTKYYGTILKWPLFVDIVRLLTRKRKLKITDWHWKMETNTRPRTLILVENKNCVMFIFAVQVNQ